MPEYTGLEIDGIVIPEFASRGMTFTLEVIEQARQLENDCNGVLVDLALPQFRKHRLTISCSEQEAPVFDEVWPGKIVTVALIAGLGLDATDTASRIMTMMVEERGPVERDEWAAQGTWSLTLQQVQAGV